MPTPRRNPRRVRRPLLALVVLIVALAIGYGVRACDSDGHGHAHGTPQVVTRDADQRAGG